MESKKKLLVFASTFPRWKDDTNPPFVYELSKRLTSDFEVFVLAPHYKGAKRFEIMDNMKIYRFKYFPEKYEKLAGSGGILPTLKKNKLFYLQVPFFLIAEYIALKKLIRKIKPDIIHAHWTIPQGFITALVKKTSRKSKRVEYIVTSHGSDLMGIKNFIFLKKFALKNSKCLTVVSNSLKEEAKKIESNVKIEVIPMGVDTKLFNPKQKDDSIKKKYKIESLFLLFVGRLAPEKGIDLLIEAMPKVIKENPKTKLMIIGEGTLKEQIQRRVNELKINNHIIFMGWVKNTDLPRYYATADVFISPSRREGSPVSYIESLSSGTPILVGDLPVSREIVGENERGWIIKKENNQDLSDKIIKISNIHSNKKIINKNKKEILEFARDNYDWDNVSKNFVEVLR